MLAVAEKVQMLHDEPTMKRASGPTSDVDRLSALPDGLLHTIMSFLPARQNVQTSLLSRRWRRLWRSAPRIEIDERDFGISVSTSSSTLEERWPRFENFATNMLLFHDNTSSLGEFRLRCRLHNWCHVDRWIRRGIEYCPSVLQIQILNYGLGVKLPPLVGSSSHHLKRLCLWNLIFDGRFADFLCSSCPFLEDMDLQSCDFCGIRPQGIISPMLNKLEMSHCSNKTGYPLVIMAPRLTNLCLTYGCYLAGISLCKMDSLVKAEIYIDENKTLSQKTQRELLGSLLNVTSLKLDGFEADAMMNENPDEFPTFSNMQTLDLSNCFLNEYELDYKLEALRSFIENAPCLEKLILQYCMFMSFSDSEWEIERKSMTLHPEDRYIYRCQNLKLIEVIYDHDHDHQLIELVWSLGISLPDASIKLNKIERWV
ncbi:hypothetical protein U9M48_012255 [Paspalum notatum var. saurae]|uniref:F-box domain-containing protein n=1 Tax=Paspalum notatum var. saurae TaxID=547442 RepID=A0AAQ3SXY3_PASNO